MNDFEAALQAATAHAARAAELHALYKDGRIHVNVPAALGEVDRPLEELIERCFPVSHAALEAASKSLFYSLPIAFDPAESTGVFLATADRDANGQPYRFLDMGALIATHAFGENDPVVVAAVLRDLPSVVSRFAHSEYQTIV
jgi:4-aminobutyrate aminotransferase-like enzyme